MLGVMEVVLLLEMLTAESVSLVESSSFSLLMPASTWPSIVESIVDGSP